MTSDKIISRIIIGIYAVLIIFGIISMTDPSWLQKISEPGRETEARTYTDEANQLMYQGKFKAAIPLYQQALEIDTANTSIYGNLGIAYLKVGEFKMAHRCFNHVKRLITEDDSMAMFNYYESMGNLEKAIGRRKQQNGDDFELHFNKSLEYYKQAMTIMPYEPNLNFKYAHLAKVMEMDSLAMKEFMIGIRKDENIATVYYAAALAQYIYLISEDDKEQTLVLKEILQGKEIPWELYDSITLKRYRLKNPQLALAYANVGELYLKKGDSEIAEKAFKRSLALNPGLLKTIEEIKSKY